MKLTVERLFDDPPLSGTLPTNLKFSPDGSFIAYLKVADDDRERMDLWRYTIESGLAECWINATALVDAASERSAAEKAERERKRQFATGITSYSFSSDGAYLLIPAAGAGYLFDIGTCELKQFTPDDSRQTDLRFSPKATYVSYVRDNDLYRFEIATRSETAITDDGGGDISNGLADFIAQEEMHRFEGYWWSPDEAFITYTRVDEGPVEVTQRFEIEADSFNVIDQHYPYAGADNAIVDLCVLELATGTVKRLDYRSASDDYLARIAWAGGRMAVQSQSRDQQELRLQFFAPDGSVYPGLTERSDTWIDLHHNFKHLDVDRFLWTSERDGSNHLYLYEGDQSQQLTCGAGRVNQILHADNERVLVSGWFDSPVEQHLYTVPIAARQPTADPARLTREPGWHELVVATDGNRYIDRFTALATPGEVRVAQVTGSGVDTLATLASLAKEAVGESHPYFPFLADHQQPVLGKLQAEDGQWIHYRLTRPAAGGASERHPVIVYVYGGPGVQRVRNEWSPLLLQLFAHNGYGVLELDNRGTSNRERSFQAPIYRTLGMVEVADQVTGAEFLRTLDWVDGERIGVFGHSYGGYMTLMCLAKAPGIFKAGVSVAPVSDWRLYDTHYTERYLATPATNAEGYESSSVFPYLDGLRGGLLLIHGMADDNVLFTHSTKLYKALQSMNVAFEMMAYPGSKHALQERAVSIHRFNLILDFFGRQL